MEERKKFLEAAKKRHQPVTKKVEHLQVKSSDASRQKLIEMDRKQGRLKSGSEKTCIICGKRTCEYRQSLSENSCICTCVGHSDALAVRVVRKKKTKEVAAEGRKCIICGGISSSDKYILDDEKCIGHCLSKERADSIYKAFNG